MRLYRKRRRQGLRSVRIWLPVTDIDYFLRLVLTERQRQRPDALQTGSAAEIPGKSNAGQRGAQEVHVPQGLLIFF